jgi:hypothetical protein
LSQIVLSSFSRKTTARDLTNHDFSPPFMPGLAR